ncbi:ABC transporter substrate-binding protein [Corynebacterium diphtheriae]
MLSKWLRLLAVCVVAMVSVATVYRTLFPARTAVTIMCSNDVTVCEQWKRDIARELGLNVRYVSLPTQEALRRLRTGSHEFDVWVGGPSENYRLAARLGLLQAVDLPAADAIPRPFKDPQNRWFGVYASVLSVCSDRDALAELGVPVPRTWSDLMRPELRGWVSAPSPVSSGTGYAMLLSMQAAGLSQDETAAIVGNVDRFTRSGNAPSDVVAHGEAAVAISYEPYCQNKTTRSGRDVEISYPAEGTSFEIASGGVVAQGHNKSAAYEVMNWLLSPSGQTSARRVGLPQIPTSDLVVGNISTRLKDSYGIVAVDPAVADSERDRWMSWFSEQRA